MEDFCRESHIIIIWYSELILIDTVRLLISYVVTPSGKSIRYETCAYIIRFLN